MNDSKQTDPVIIYTDGACSGNPGPGGWGAVMMKGTHRRELKGAELDTTNNRMELMGAIMALEALKQRSRVELYTDSTYLRQGITEWIHGWKRNGWKTANKKPVKNADLWQRLDNVRKEHNVDWHWVKGHAGHPENERADELARIGIIELLAADRHADDSETGEPAMPFELDKRINADTVGVAELELCTVRLMNERRYVWLILVPKRAGLVELHDLDEFDARQLMHEARRMSALVKSLFAPEKVNVAAIGNIVRQLHVHVIARNTGDAAWPGPVWGHSPVEHYHPDALEEIRGKLAAAIAADDPTA